MNQQRLDEIRRAVDEGEGSHLLQVVSDRPPVRLDFQHRVLIRELLDGICALQVQQRPGGGYQPVEGVVDAGDLPTVHDTIDQGEDNGLGATGQPPTLEWEAHEVGTWIAWSAVLIGRRKGLYYKLRMVDLPEVSGCVFTIDKSHPALGIYSQGDAVRRFRTLAKAMTACETHEWETLAKIAAAVADEPEGGLGWVGEMMDGICPGWSEAQRDAAGETETDDEEMPKV